MQKTRIFYITTDSNIGGTERMLLALLKNLDRERFEPFLCVLKPGGRLLEEARKLNVETECLNVSSKFDFMVLSRLKSLLIRENPSVLHTFLFHANILGRIAGSSCRIPVIISSQRSVDEWRKFYHSVLDGWSSRFCHLIISNSEAGRRRLIEREKIPADKIITIHNGIDVSRFEIEIDVQKKRKELGLDPDDKVIGIIANLRRVKGHRYMFEALRDLHSRIKDVKIKLLVVGEGKLKRQLGDLADRLKIKDSVVFCGFRDDIPEVLRAIDILVLPSLWEGFPVSVLEAMASGLPVVASDVGGVSEVVQNGRNGVLVRPADYRHLSTALYNLIREPERILRLGAEGKKLVGEKFTLKKMIEDTEDIYDKLLRQQSL